MRFRLTDYHFHGDNGFNGIVKVNSISELANVINEKCPGYELTEYILTIMVEWDCPIVAYKPNSYDELTIKYIG